MSMTSNKGPRVLIASLEARTDKLEKGLAKANATIARNMGGVENRMASARRRVEGETAAMAAKANSNLSRIGVGLKPIGVSIASGFLGGFAAGSVQGFASEIRNATRSMAELQGEAKRAGLGVEAFQALGFAARQNGVSVDALVDGMKELQLRADEFIITGKGSGAEAFARLGYGADELKAKLRDPSALLVEIIGRLQRLDTAAQIRIADEIFGGTGGEQFVRFLDQGEAGLRRNIDEARRLGVVLDEDVVRKGAELDREFQKIADTIGSNIKNAVVSVATSLASWSTNVEGFLNRLGNSSFFKRWNDLLSNDLEAGYYGATPNKPQTAPTSGALDPKAVDRLREALRAAGQTARANVPDRAQHLPTSFVDQKLAGLQTDFRASLAGFILAAREAGHDIKIQSGFRSIERQQQLWSAAVAKYGSEEAARKWVAPPGRSYHNKGTAADLNYAGGGMSGSSPQANAARMWAHQNAARFGLTFPLGNEAWHVEPSGQRGQPKDGDPDTSALERQTTNRTEAQIAADRQAEAVQRVMEALGLEAAQIGQTAEKQELLQRLQAAGVDINSREGQAIAAKVQELYRLKAAQDRVEQSAEQAKRAREEMADMGASATKGIISDLRNGATAAEAFGNALASIADRLISMAADQIFAKAFAAPAGGGGGGLGFFSLIGSLFGLGFSEGGYTGPGAVNQPAGVVHKGEVVWSQDDVARAGGVSVVEGMRLGQRGYARGGAVAILPAVMPALAAPAIPSASEAMGGTVQQSIHFAPQITVHGSAGTPEQNHDLAKQISKEMEGFVRAQAAAEIRASLRPGNVLNAGRR